MNDSQCPATIWVGNQKIRCSNGVVGTGPIIDFDTGERAAPYQHFVGGFEHYGSAYNVFHDEYGHPLNVTIRWSNSAL